MASLKNNHRHGEQGNVVLITLIIVLAIAALGLGLNLLLRTRVDQEFQLRTIGDVPTQARYVAEIGINQLLFNLNAGGTAVADCPNPNPNPCPDDATPNTCKSGSGYFPAPVFQQSPSRARYTGAYSLAIDNTTSPATIIAKACLTGSGANYTHTVTVNVQSFTDGDFNRDNRTRWQVVPNTWKESLP